MKSNIGHTQAAAGVAGVIKMVHGDAARGAAARRCTWTSRTPQVDWSAGAVGLLTEAAGRGRRRGGRGGRGCRRSGSAGTNAHVILEEAPAGSRPAGRGWPRAAPGRAAGRAWCRVVVSARSAGALAGAGGAAGGRVGAGAGRLRRLADAGRSLASRRAVLAAPGGGGRRRPGGGWWPGWRRWRRASRGRAW